MTQDSNKNEQRLAEIKQLSNKMIEAAELGEWSNLLTIETNWLAKIKQLVETYKEDKLMTLTKNDLETYLAINNELIFKCKRAKSDISDKLNVIKHGRIATNIYEEHTE